MLGYLFFSPFYRWGQMGLLGPEDEGVGPPVEESGEEEKEKKM